MEGHKRGIIKQLSILASRIVNARENLKSTRPEVVEKQIFDVPFKQLLNDPVGLIKSMYEKFGLEYSDEFDARIKHYLNNQPRDTYGRVPHSLEELNLTKEEIDEEFKEYIEQYKSYF